MPNIISSILSKLRSIEINMLLKKSIKRHNNGPIVFICQCEYIWNKTRNIFIELVNRKANVILYIVKDNNSISKNDKTIFEIEYPDYCIHHEDKPLKELNPSLVIFTRPYDHYLPTELQSANVLKYTKTGFVPYYYSTENDTLSDTMFKRVNYFFADCDETYNSFNNICKKNVKKGIQKAYNFGYPVFENLLDIEGENIYKDNNKLKIMWTPRWTLDESLGGSNFLNYYEDMFKLLINNNDYSFVFRPHPLLFKNFVEKGIITEEVKNKIINNINESNNSIYDTRSDYIDTFNNTDILITDMSAIIVEYFLTGKPMIFCPSKTTLKNNRIVDIIIESNYIANSFSDILKHIESIKENDYKKEIRDKYLSEFKNKNNNASKNIVDVILNEII